MSERPSFKEVLLNETGQMSVFIALIFQVLFVFFAMVVNIGLLVHDKINLQNAVDLGAYYAAQRQAEILNEIAHINYQIRQDYKLFAWRYRVLGNMGKPGVDQQGLRVPPGLRPPNQQLTDDPWEASPGTPEVPITCVAHNMWSDMLRNSENENYCFSYETIQPIPPVTVIAPWIPLIGTAAAATAASSQRISASCNSAGPMNWAFAAYATYAFKHSVAIRKQMIWELRQRLLSENMLDIEMQSVRTGVEKTIKKNLTQSNLDGFIDGEFELINGFTQGEAECQDPEFVLPEIKTTQTLLYVFMREVGRSCVKTPTFMIRGQPRPADDVLAMWDPDGSLRAIVDSEPFGAADPSLQALHSSLGFEKNPWCMAYTGVKASTRPHKPFAPFGSPIRLTARAFAQPFGGRVGPWYGATWTPGASMSSLSPQLRVDPLTTPRLAGGGGEITAGSEWMPNYSRYPGDKLGLMSKATLGAQRHILNQIAAKPKLDRLYMRYYSFFDAIADFGDSLAWDPFASQSQKPQGTLEMIRRAEVAAIAPDLFDVTYYSIEPNYWANFHQYNQQLMRFPAMSGRKVLGRNVRPMPDLGGRNAHPELQPFSVKDQIAVAMGGGLDPQGFLANPQISYYPIRDWEHLLTGWAPNGVQDFRFPSQRFARCERAASEGIPTLGSCQVGGRTGYSVRLLSRDHLIEQSWRVGGEGTPAAKILNPPPIDW